MNNKLKASATVEMALVMPIVFAVLIMLIFFVLMLYQKAISFNYVNRYTLMASNSITDSNRTPLGYIDKASFNKRVWSYYLDAGDYFQRNNTAGEYTAKTSRALGIFNTLRSRKIEENIQIKYENYSVVTMRTRDTYKVRMPFVGGLKGDFNIRASAPEINPSKYIRNTDDANMVLQSFLGAMDNPIIQIIINLLDFIKSR